MSPHLRFLRFWGNVRNETLLALILILLGVDVIEGKVLESGGSFILRVISWLFVLGGLVFACSRDRKHVLQVIFLVVPGGFLMFAYAWEPVPATLGGRIPLLVSSALMSAALLLVSYRMLRGILRAKIVRADMIAGSLCVYLLLALAWSFIYTCVFLLADGPPEKPPFNHLAPDLVATGEYSPRGLQRELTYFSFVTITTLGYGDITPASVSAKTLSFLEAVIGQLYLIVLVSRLVGLHIAHQFRRD